MCRERVDENECRVPRAPPHLLPRTGKQAAGAIDVSFRRDNRRAMKPRRLVPIGASVDNNADCHSPSCHGNLDDSLSTQPPGRKLSSTGEDVVHSHEWRLCAVLSPTCLLRCSCWGLRCFASPDWLEHGRSDAVGHGAPFIEQTQRAASLGARPTHTLMNAGR